MYAEVFMNISLKIAVVAEPELTSYASKADNICGCQNTHLLQLSCLIYLKSGVTLVTLIGVGMC